MKDRIDCAVGEREGPLDVPDDVDWESNEVEVHPVRLRRMSTPQVEPERRAPPEGVCTAAIAEAKGVREHNSDGGPITRRHETLADSLQCRPRRGRRVSVTLLQVVE